MAVAPELGLEGGGRIWLDIEGESIGVGGGAAGAGDVGARM